jgi:hypothetical protein
MEASEQPLDKLGDELEFKWGSCNDPSYHTP